MHEHWTTVFSLLKNKIQSPKTVQNGLKLSWTNLTIIQGKKPSTIYLFIHRHLLTYFCTRYLLLNVTLI